MAVQAEAINQRAPSTEREKSTRRERMLYTGMSIAFLLTVIAGFSRTYFLRPYFNPQPLIPLLYLHGIIFSAWLILLLTQTCRRAV